MKDNEIHTHPPETPPTLRVVPMPCDTNAEGDIFGGWLLAQMDLAGATRAYQIVGHRIVTIGVQSMTFHSPIFVGDEVSFFTDVKRIGRTSVTININVWARQRHQDESRFVSEGVYTYVAIDKDRKPTEIKK